MSKPKLGKRYRVDLMGHEIDGRIGVLERVEGLTAWLMRAGRLYPVPLSALRDKGVLQSIPEPLAQTHFTRQFEVFEPVGF
jgi:hypothetical protein